MAEDSAKPSEHTTDDGQTFYNAALTGSGTILPDGTYGEPLPDPTVQRGGVKSGRHNSGGYELPEPPTVFDPESGKVAPEQRSSSTTNRNAKK